MGSEYHARIGFDYRPPKRRSAKFLALMPIVAGVSTVGAVLGALSFSVFWVIGTFSSNGDNPFNGPDSRTTFVGFLLIGMVLAWVFGFSSLFSRAAESKRQPARNAEDRREPGVEPPRGSTKSFTWVGWLLFFGLAAIAGTMSGELGKALAGKAMVRSRPSQDASQQLVLLAQRLTRDAPVWINESTRLDSAIAGPGPQLTYVYTLPAVRMPVEESSPEIRSFLTQMEATLRHEVCTSPGLKELREIAGRITYRYLDAKGLLIRDVSIVTRDCRRK